MQRCASRTASGMQLIKLYPVSYTHLENADGVQLSQVYLSAYYYTERDIAERLKALSIKGEQDRRDTERRLKKVESETGIESVSYTHLSSQAACNEARKKLIYTGSREA